MCSTTPGVYETLDGPTKGVSLRPKARTSSAIAGGIFFGEYAQLHLATAAGEGGWALYVLGILTMLAGLALIADGGLTPH